MLELDWDIARLTEGAALITTIDTHTAGEPLRIITGGLPPLPGATILERRRFMRERLDHIRRALMWEPRGHYDMYGAVLTPPVTPGADLGVLFLHNEGYSTMCGHGVIGLVTALCEGRALPGGAGRREVRLDTPAGLVAATAHYGADGHVASVSFRNVPSFVLARDLSVEAPGWGRVTLDVAFGGAFYAILPAAQLGLRVEPAQRPRLVAAAEAIKAAVNAALPIRHPHEDDLGFLYGVILTDAPEDPAHHSRNLCVFANAEVDRSPTGTGVSARLALEFAAGRLAAGETITIESILGARSAFSGRIVGEERVGDYAAVIPEVRGSAFVTGVHQFVLNPADALSGGFLLGA
jgi:trans-L-3-hydroxyproline dehydratase